MNTWRPDWLLRILLTWTSLTFILAWLPFVRCTFDGATYNWGFSWWGIDVGGSGISAHFLLLVVEVGLGVALIWLGYRGARKPFHWLLIAWHTAIFTSFTTISLLSPEEFRFRGDTAGVDFSLAWVGPVFTGGFLVASIYWVVRNLRKPDQRQCPPWSRWNTIWLACLIGLLPIQFMLFRFDDMNWNSDLVGVFITIGQWMLFGDAIRPRGKLEGSR
ncbi:MAG: hypothetical protein O7G85_06180 [Planctomycetota bacterium]|nr:hypothetical protein [Planctomycetota bacterium]